MKPALQRRIQRYGWDRAAPYYDTGWQKQLWPAQQKLLDWAAIRPGENVLDISCGTGLVTLPAADSAAPGGTVHAIDLSEGMIEEARGRAMEAGLDNIAFRAMDAESLDFPDLTFDVVICSLGLMYFPDPEKALRQMYRVLAPGGRAAALVWGRRNRCGWAEIFPIVDRCVKSDVCPLFFRLGTGSTLTAGLESAGFEAVQTERFSADLSFKNDEQACLAAFQGGAVALAYQKFGPDVRETVHRQYLQSIAPFGSDHRGYRVPGEFVLAGGRKRS